MHVQIKQQRPKTDFRIIIKHNKKNEVMPIELPNLTDIIFKVVHLIQHKVPYPKPKQHLQCSVQDETDGDCI